MPHDTLTFVLLAEEFGGTKFGPFDGPEIRFGSDPERSDIRLPETLGVLPEHVKIIPQRDKSFILAPTERSAGVFVWRQGSKPKQVTSPVAIQDGDGFSLVTEQGPRFYMSVELPPDLPRDKPKQGLDKAKGRISGGSLLNEIKRRGLASVLTTGVGHFFQNAYTFIASGAILQPRYIIAGVLLLGSWIVAGGASCAALKLNFDLSAAKSSIEEREADLAECSMLDNEEPTLATVTASILGDQEWVSTLNGDGELRAAYVAELKALQKRNARTDYEWVYKKNSGSPFVSFHNRLVREEYPQALTRVLQYAAAVNRQDRDRGDWNMLREDSAGAEVCAHGPIQLTFRQATQLEFDEVQLDALVPGTVAASNDVEPKRAALTQTALDAGLEDVEFNDDSVADAKADIQGGKQCIYVEGEDDRASVNKIAPALTKVIGPDAKGVPPVSEDYWVAARLVKMYSADFKLGYEQLDFTDGAPSVVLAEATDSEKRFAIEQAGTLMARSVAISCWAALDRELQEPPEHMAPLPDKLPCYILSYLLDEEG